MDQELLTKLQGFLGDNEKVSQKEFKQFAKLVTDFIQQTKDITEKEIASIQKVIEVLRAEIKQENTGALETMKNSVDQVFVGDKLSEMGGKIDMSLSELKQTISKIVDRKVADVDNKLSTVKDGKSLTFEDLTEDQREALRGKPGVPDNEAILALKKELDEIRELLKQGRGMTLGSLVSTRTRFVDDETPSGTINGSNTTFTLSKIPLQGSLKLYRGGSRQRITEDFTLSGRTITFIVAPVSGEVLLADFRW